MKLTKTNLNRTLAAIKAKTPAASDQISFKVGTCLQIDGPAKFPFSLSMVVVGSTRTNRMEMASKQTRLAMAVDTPIKDRVTLNHWSNTMDFSILLEKYGPEFDVTVKICKCNPGGAR